MQVSGERRCMLPTTSEVLLRQHWIFSNIYEKTPEATSAHRPPAPPGLLGRGPGGTVYKRELQLPQCESPCLQCPVAQVCAVKRLGGSHVLFAHDPDRRQREKEIMGHLDKQREWHSSGETGYQFIVAFYGSYEDTSGIIHIVMECMPDGDLGHYLDFIWSERDAKIIAEQVLHALKFMHSKGVVHRDIKPFNIFPKIDGDCCLTVKVGDFGIANQGNQGLFYTYVGTLEYMAPERFGSGHTVAVDSWAVGCLLFRVLAGKDLFDNAKEICNYEYTKEPSLEVGLAEFSDLAIQFIDKLVQPDAKHRADPETALTHPWLHDLPGEFGRRPAAQKLKDDFDRVKSAGIIPRGS